MQIKNVFPELQRHVGVVPHQVFYRVDLRVARHQDTAHRRTQIIEAGYVALLAHIREHLEQGGRFFFVGAGEIPLDKIVVGFGTEEAPGHHPAGVDKVLNVVVRLSHRHGVEGGGGQVVQALETAALQQFGQAALQRYVEAGVGAKGGKHAAGFRVHQGYAHHRELAAKGGILHQYRETLFFQGLDALNNPRVLGQHAIRHIRQGDFVFNDLFLHCPLEDLGQALHLRFLKRVAGAHAVAQIQVFDQVGGEVHGFPIGMTHVGNAADAPLRGAGVGVIQVGAQQFTVGVVDGQAMVVQDALGQLAFRPRLEPFLVRVMHELAVGDVLAEVLVVVEEVAVQALNKLAQGRAQGRFFGRALAVGEAHMGSSIAHV